MCSCPSVALLRAGRGVFRGEHILACTGMLEGKVGFQPPIADMNPNLGVDLGVAAASSQWDSLIPRITRRAHDIRQAGASIGTRTALHNVHISSMIRYRASFFPPSDRLVRTQRHSAQLVLNAPWHAIPHSVLVSFGSLGFQTDLHDAQVVCKAALLASAFSPAASDAWRAHDHIAQSDAAARDVLHDGTFLRPWHGHSSCSRIMRAIYLRHNGIGQIRIDASMTQRQITRMIRPTAQTRHDAALLALRRRACKWDEVVPEALVAAYLSFVGGRPPAELVVACLRSLCNAWCTPARFGNPPSPCIFRCRMLCGDCQTHLLACPVFHRWLSAHLYSIRIAASPSVVCFLRSLAPPDPLGIREAMSIDIALWAADSIRHGAADTRMALFSARLKELVLRHSMCRRAAA